MITDHRHLSCVIIKTFLPQKQRDELIHSAAYDGSPRGQALRVVLQQGIPIPKEIVGNMIKAALARTKAKGAILEGFPADVHEAAYFEEEVLQFREAIFLNVPDDELKRRFLDTFRANELPDREQKELLSVFGLRMQRYKESRIALLEHFGSQDRACMVPYHESEEDTFYTAVRMLSGARPGAALFRRRPSVLAATTAYLSNRFQGQRDGGGVVTSHSAALIYTPPSSIQRRFG